MKSTSITISFLAILIIACQSANNDDILVDLSQTINLPSDSLFQQLGEITEKVNHSGKYPCEKSDCMKFTFQDGKYEVITRNDMVEWLTINKIPDYSGNENALQYLGLSNANPDFINPGIVTRWENYNNIHEISFFPDYALIIFSEPD
ncbi:hypothetical protein [Ekhidna sp.]|uniref:hypothetical protein n=1 Tax=Ekhidna sp. TaxID=2608089 RepID=UPI003CCC2EA3